MKDTLLDGCGAQPTAPTAAPHDSTLQRNTWEDRGFAVAAAALVGFIWFGSWWVAYRISQMWGS